MTGKSARDHDEYEIGKWGKLNDSIWDINTGLNKKGKSGTYAVNTIGTLMVKRPACVCDGEDDDDDDDDGDDGDDLFLLVFCCW